VLVVHDGKLLLTRRVIQPWEGKHASEENRTQLLREESAPRTSISLHLVRRP
jgi:hypothetical protein